VTSRSLPEAAGKGPSTATAKAGRSLRARFPQGGRGGLPWPGATGRNSLTSVPLRAYAGIMYLRSKGIDTTRQLALDIRLLMGLAWGFWGGARLYGGILLRDRGATVVGAVSIAAAIAVVAQTVVQRRRLRRRGDPPSGASAG
jgi:hypothetical protein